MRHVFLLGCERSGTTWLSNIFDAHPLVELMIEPFADYAELFPGVPDRNTHATGSIAACEEAVTAGFQGLRARKYPLFYRRGRSVRWMDVDRLLVDRYERLRKRLRCKPSLWAARYLALNLNSRETPAARRSAKPVSPSVIVTKELRLNFKIPVLAAAFLDAYYVVAMRDPGAQIESIQRLFGKGSLGELRGSLPRFLAAIGASERFREYRPLIGTLGPDDLLPFWWLVNYQTLLEDLRDHRQRFEVMCHETLCEAPDREAEQLLARCGLDYPEPVRAYVAWSSHQDSRDPSPVLTTRNSAAFYREAIRRVDPGLRDRIRRVGARVSDVKRLDPAVSRYLQPSPPVEEA